MGSELKNGLVESVDGVGREAGYRARSKRMSASHQLSVYSSEAKEQRNVH